MNTDDIKRLRFYEQQFLRAKDFQDEQAYHIEMRRRHLIAHHTWGIVVGLDIDRNKDANVWSVKPGLAVDGFGREIVAFSEEPLDLVRIRAEAQSQLGEALKVGAEGKLGIWIIHYLEKTDLPARGYETCGEADGTTRIRESFRLLYRNTPLLDDPARHKLDDPDTWPQPFEDLPEPEKAPWSVFLGTIQWECVSSETDLTKKEIQLKPFKLKITKDGKEVEEERPYDASGRQYVGNITAEIIAPAAELKIRDRASKTLEADKQGVSVSLEGSLQVERLLTTSQDTHIKGKLGIGTLQPPSKDDKCLDTASTIRIGNGHIVTNNPNGALYLNAGPADNTQQAGIWVRTTNKLGEESSATDLMRITEAGNVGVGTTTPIAKLQVAGAVAFEKIVSDGNPLLLPSGTTLIWNDGTWLRINQNLDSKKVMTGVRVSGVLAFDSLAIGEPGNQTDPGIGNVLIPGKVGIGTKDLDFPKMPDPFPKIQLYVQGEVAHSGGTGSGFSFGNRDTPSYIASPSNGERWEWYAAGGVARLWSGGDKIAIAPGGNMGIGTITSQNKLDIAGGAVIGMPYAGTNTAPPNGLLVAGNVGIGTTSPQQNLSVNGALNVDQANQNDSSINPGITFGSNSGEGIASKRTPTGNQNGLDLYTNSLPRLSITNNGMVGIGTTLPQATLDVAGSFRLGTNGSAFTEIQTETFLVGNNSSNERPKVVEILFPNAFSTVPRVMVTARGNNDLLDTFSVSVRSITNNRFRVNIIRVDSANPWTEQLFLDWIAWT